MKQVLVASACLFALLPVCQAACPEPAGPGLHLVGCWDAQGRQLQQGESTLPSNATCLLMCQDVIKSDKNDNSAELPYVRVTCWRGSWDGVELPCRGTAVESTDVTHALVRHKRFLEWILFGIISLAFLIGRLIAMDTKPPQIICPRVDKTQSDLGQTSASVSWPPLSPAYDAEEKRHIDVYLISRVGPGGTFGEGTTEVWYGAKDRSGNEGTCKVVVVVEVSRCYGPVGVDHGQYVCYPSTPHPGSGADYVRGTSCHYGCYVGYRLHGPAIRTCIAQNEWNGPLPDCTPVECEALTDPPYAQHSCSNERKFLSACSFSCIEGFAIEAGSSSVRVCGATGSWRGDQPQCKDSDPPRFEMCNAFQTLVADKGEDSCLTTWQEPIVKDNSGEVISPELRGPLTLGQRGQAGIYRLVYSARDSEGNAARECVITLVIKELTCPQQFAKPFQRVHCPNGNRYGSSCSFTCDTGFRQNGSDVSDCVMSDTSSPYALWEWSHGTPPQCEVGETCPRLKAPVNGALACDAWENGDFCKLMCQDGTDIPDSYAFSVVARLLVCHTNPTLGPHWNYDKPLPECTRVTPGHGLVMEATMSYYTGHCFEEVARKQIKENFITFMTTKSNYQEPCKNNSGCSVQNVEVTCGPVRNRRSLEDEDHGYSQAGSTTEARVEGIQDSEGPFQVRFTLQLRATTSGAMDPRQEFLVSALASSQALSSLQAELSGSLDDLLPESSNASLPLSELQLEVIPPQLDCLPGTLPSYSSYACVSCPKGSYFASSSKSCVPCPVGQYQSTPGQTECLPCPRHRTTLHNGSPSVLDCVDQCPPGQISADGILPCSPCAKGFYQPEHGRTSCLACPQSSATLYEGAITRSQCQEFDLVFPKNANASMYLEVLGGPVLVMPLTLALWFKPDSDVKVTFFDLSWSGHELLVRLEDNASLAVELDSAASVRLDNVTSGEWHHLVVKVGDGVTSVFLDRQGQSQNVSSASSFQDFSNITSFSVTLGGEGFSGSLSQFDLWSGQGSSPPPSPTPHCQQPRGGGGDVVSWRAWLQAQDRGAIMQLPSLCDDTNECDSNPCVHGACADDFHDFQCLCDPGFMGKACDVNKDDCVAHLCNHNATCVDGVGNYTCTCPPEYTGFFCDDIVTAGNWGTWSNWSACSVSCGKGEHFRVRRCDNPSPQNGGLPCEGNATQHESCNDGPCPECPDLRVPDHARLQCQEEEGLRRCQLLCEDGFDFDVEPLPEYTCGLQSGYVWNLQTDANPNRTLPSCLEIKPAEEVTIVYNATYRNLTCNSRALAVEASARITEVMRQATGSVECVRTQRCRVTDHVVVNCDRGTGRRRRDASRAGLSITVVNSPQSVGIQTGIEDTVAAVLHLNTSGHSGAFTVTVQGQQFMIDVTSADVSGHVRCRSGWAKVNFYCVPCGPGTHWKDGYCLRCPVGTFQGGSAQAVCLSCPTGRSTPGQGSLSAQECTVELDMPSKVAMIVGAVLGSFIAVVSLIVVYVLYRKWSKKHKQVKTLEMELTSNRDLPTSTHARYTGVSEKEGPSPL